jgi:hypothetical protein
MFDTSAAASDGNAFQINSDSPPAKKPTKAPTTGPPTKAPTMAPTTTSELEFNITSASLHGNPFNINAPGLNGKLKPGKKYNVSIYAVAIGDPDDLGHWVDDHLDPCADNSHSCTAQQHSGPTSVVPWPEGSCSVFLPVPHRQCPV